MNSILYIYQRPSTCLRDVICSILVRKICSQFSPRRISIQQTGLLSKATMSSGDGKGVSPACLVTSSNFIGDAVAMQTLGSDLFIRKISFITLL